MPETSLSLLNRLKQSSDSESWNRLLELYAPLLTRWLVRFDVQAADADDLIQEVMLTVHRDLKSFEHAGHSGAFRSWLRTILVNRLRQFWRQRGKQSDRESRLAELEDPESGLSQLWNEQHDQHLLRQLLALVEPHFAANSWQAFCRVALQGQPADEVARELGMTLNAVFIAKSRILGRLRQEADGLVAASSDFLANP